MYRVRPFISVERSICKLVESACVSYGDVSGGRFSSFFDELSPGSVYAVSFLWALFHLGRFVISAKMSRANILSAVGVPFRVVPFGCISGDDVLDKCSQRRRRVTRLAHAEGEQREAGSVGEL